MAYSRQDDAASLLAALLFIVFTFPGALEGRPQAMRFERLSIEEGLSQSVVCCILQDDTGFMWFGTQDGLNRYDGHRFVIYRHDAEDSASLPHDWVKALLEDPSGDVWVGTDGGLARWRKATDSFTTYRHDSEDLRSLSGDKVWALAWDPSGAMWVGTSESGLNRFDTIAGTFQRFHHDPAVPASLSSDVVRAVRVDRSGTVWVGTLGGLDLFDAEYESFLHFRHDPTDSSSLSDNRVLAIFEDRHGILWVGTQAGLNRLGKRSSGRGDLGPVKILERFRHEPGDPGSLSHSSVRKLLEDRDGRMWVGTDRGLDLWHEECHCFASYRHDPGDPHSLSGDKISSIYQDRSGVLWVGAFAAGLSRWHPGTWSFSLYASGDPGSSNAVLAISEDSDGMLWIGTLGGGLEQIDRATGRRIRYKHDPRNRNSLSGDQVSALLHGRGRSLWIGTVAEGLNRLDGGNFERYRHDPEDTESLSADAVTTLFEDRDGRLWIGTFGGGLDLFQGDARFLHFRHDAGDSSSLGSDRVLSLAEDGSGRLWVATAGGGLNRLNFGTGDFLRLKHDLSDPASLSSNEPQIVHFDPLGQLWVGTKGKGLNRLDDLDEATGRAIFSHFTRAEGLPDETIWGIRSDLAGDLWLSSNRGLTRFEPNTETVRTYTRSHGLQSNEFNIGAHFLSPSGELFFGGVRGLNAFFPDRIETNRQPPSVVVTSFSKTGQSVSFERPVFEVEEIALDHRDYFFSFEVAALDYSAPEENRYRYKLDGFDTSWVDLGTRRQITFTNLDAGRYTLRIQGSNNDEVWSKEGATVRLVIAPPPWETWWAYLFYLLAIATALAGIFRLQRGRVERQKEEELQELDRIRKEEELKTAESWALALVEKNVQVEEKNQEILRAQAQLVHSEKMAALGQMVAGVAHEINNPVNFISSGLPALRRDVAALVASVPPGRRDESFDKLSQRVAKLFEAISEGSRRTAETVKDLRSFARLDEAEFKCVDLHAALSTTLALLRNQTKDSIEVVKNFGEVPPVECYVGQLNQVFMNLLINSVQAIDGEGTIAITTARDGDDYVRISIRDSGCGMPDEVQRRIFDPFFTTKPVGQGTGLGLSISHGIIDRHRGTIRLESQPGEGAEFTITLPIRHPEDRGTQDAHDVTPIAGE